MSKQKDVEKLVKDLRDFARLQGLIGINVLAYADEALEQLRVEDDE